VSGVKGKLKTPSVQLIFSYPPRRIRFPKSNSVKAKPAYRQAGFGKNPDRKKQIFPAREDWFFGGGGSYPAP
jgi:hypothetical protein